MISSLLIDKKTWKTALWGWMEEVLWLIKEEFGVVDEKRNER